MSKWKQMSSGASHLVIRVGPADREAIVEAITLRKSWVMPDRGHDDETDEGAILAEICRGWLEYHHGQ